MALSRQNLSPTANLLRNSRLFSLPKPLPKPLVSTAMGAGIAKASETATLPYPTHQAIATTKASLARGDWGLKRNLPSKSYLVQVSDPVLRIKQLDTIEHVTDFDSAADHVRTRQKWEEMGVPMMKGMTQMRDYDLSGTPPGGAFEVRDDTTSYDTNIGLDEAGLYLKALKDNKKAPDTKEALVAQRRERRDAIAKQRSEQRRAFNATWAEKLEAKKAEWSSQNLSEKEQFKSLRAFRKQEKAAINAFKKDLDASTSTSRPLPFSPFTPPAIDGRVHNTKRWKHEGPWIPGMGADDFVTFLSRSLPHRQAEFKARLVEFAKNEIYAKRRLAASTSTETAPIDIDEARIWQQEQERAFRTITPAQVAASIKALRKETANNPLGSKLVTKLIQPFLRLPSIKFKYTSYAEDASTRAIDQYQFDQETAPLSTHPSAGLGYLRSKSYIANHPLLGPQANPHPVPARVVQARTTSTTKEAYARLGVAGFIANDQFRSTDTSSASKASHANSRDVETIDIDTVGGKKVLVQPQFGSVTNDGRIHIKIKRSLGPEVAVARGELDDLPPVRDLGESSAALRGLGGGVSGVRELDEQSARARQLSGFLGGKV